MYKIQTTHLNDHVFPIDRTETSRKIPPIIESLRDFEPSIGIRNGHKFVLERFPNRPTRFMKYLASGRIAQEKMLVIAIRIATTGEHTERDK